jgi:hypothetical protein
MKRSPTVKERLSDVEDLSGDEDLSSSDIDERSKEGTKRSKLNPQLDELDKLIVFFAFSCVRMSGLCNMMDQVKISGHVMNVLCLWRRSDLAKFLNEKRENYVTMFFEWLQNITFDEKQASDEAAAFLSAEDDKDTVREEYIATLKKQKQQNKTKYEEGASGMPYGKDYMIAASNFDPNKMSEKLINFQKFLDHHAPDALQQRNYDWSTALVGFASALSLESAVFARDISKLRSLQGEYDLWVLQKSAAVNGLFEP